MKSYTQKYTKQKGQPIVYAFELTLNNDRKPIQLLNFFFRDSDYTLNIIMYCTMCLISITLMLENCYQFS